MINLMITGHLGDDAHVDGDNMRFRMASTEKYKDKKTDQMVENTTWITIFSRKAKLGKFLKKGMAVTVVCSNVKASVYNENPQLSANARDIWFSTSGLKQEAPKPEPPPVATNQEDDDLPF